jgi:hypothetical protein
MVADNYWMHHLQYKTNELGYEETPTKRHS